ncbi:MAG TPA: DUF2993 domain-containing protein [Actinomycetes bacterium]|nr:DUF2993 domain-containing protein [Actinomycetes bacterium]
MRAFLVVVVVLLLAAVGADRVAEHVASNRAEVRLANEGVQNPQVSVGGFPFLTQLAARSFRSVTVTGDAVTSSSGSAQDLTVVAHDVTVPKGGHATAASVHADGLVTYAEVVRRSGARGVSLSAATGGRVRMHGTATVLGQSVPVAALGRVHASGRSLRIEPTGFEVAGATVDGASVLDALGARFTLVYRLRDLPAGLTLSSVQATPDGFRVVVTGTDVKFPTG